MSRAELFSELTNLVDIDPFALLGISVSADEKRIAKRYRQIAKQLHPDAIASTAQGIEVDTAAQVIARIVNPSYQKLKHDKGRQEKLSTLRLRVRRLARTEKLVPTFQNAQQLAQTAVENVDIFYEQTLSQLAEGQFYT
jgi:curved DNA-binding protein CbpA